MNSLPSADVKQAVKERFSKLRISLRYWMLGQCETDRSWLIPLKALDFAERYHCGTRKDGFSPEFLHQLEIAQHLRTLRAVIGQPSLVIAVALLHDVCEDYNIGFEEIEAVFGKDCAQAVQLLTKKHRGTKKPLEQYFDDIATCPVASVVKLADRIHNLSSMVGVFTPEKQLAYCQEASTYFLNLLKTAKRSFPEQEAAYENLKSTLMLQIKLCTHVAQGALEIERLNGLLEQEWKKNQRQLAMTVKHRARLINGLLGSLVLARS